MMPSPSLKSMNVEALMSLRNQVDKRLVELRAELEKQLAAIPGQRRKSMGKSSLKGKKVPPKYRSPSGETWAGRGARPRWMVEALARLARFLSMSLRGEDCSLSLDNNNPVNNQGQGKGNGSGNRAGDKGGYKGLAGYPMASRKHTDQVKDRKGDC
jgi:DNA-binding protein H-NS